MVSPRSFSRFLAFSFFSHRLILLDVFSSIFEISLDIPSRDMILFMGTLLK